MSPPGSSTDASNTGGAKALNLQGRFLRRNERLAGMSNQERQWRAQWLRDQVLSPNEPIQTPEVHRLTNNIFKRFFGYPINLVQKVLTPVIGPGLARCARASIGLGTCFYAAGFFIHWNTTFLMNDWTRIGGWRVHENYPAVYPGDPEYPKARPPLKINEYHNCDFKNSPI